MLSTKPFLAAIVLACASWTAPAMAGPYGDDLSKCLVNSSTQDDKQGLVQWIFFAISLNPNTEPYVKVTSEQRAQTDKRMAQLLEKLLTESCVKEAKLAVQYEGDGALKEAFGILGRVATTEIFNNPQVSAGAEKFVQYLDVDKINTAIGLPKAKE
ncbi:MAG: hypothetical protein JNM58_02970 [Xanthomonadaceae bacterium]|nr:hypothetical protein [Xanthomonadaceae bacterium]